MKTVYMIWKREVRAFFGAFSCGFALAAFLAACGCTFGVLLRGNEGSVLQIQSLWGVSVALWLPVLSALLTTRLFSEERATGSIEMLMSAPVREREVVLGKFLSALTMVVLAMLVTLTVPLWILPRMSPHMQGGVSFLAFAAALLILLLQASVWCAAGTLISLFFSNQTAAAVCSLLLCCALPAAVYFAVMAWVPALRAEMAWMPLLVHVYDFSTGLFSAGFMMLYLATTLFFLFVCSKSLACLRLID
jgi:ABC-2 type transport system permease protein